VIHNRRPEVGVRLLRSIGFLLAVCAAAAVPRALVATTFVGGANVDLEVSRPNVAASFGHFVCSSGSSNVPVNVRWQDSKQVQIQVGTGAWMLAASMANETIGSVVIKVKAAQAPWDGAKLSLEVTYKAGKEAGIKTQFVKVPLAVPCP
jgi:hypothetical protein